MTPVTRSETLKDVLQELLALISKAGLRLGLLLLDCGFYSVEIIRYLQQARAAVPDAGDRPWPQGRPSPRTQRVERVQADDEERLVHPHVLQNAKKKKATVAICVRLHRLTDRHGRKKWDSWVYAYWGIAPQAAWIGSRGTDPKRFGIETSYRQMNQCRILDDHEEVQCTVLVRGDRAVAEKPVGVAASLRGVESALRSGRRDNWEDPLRVERMLLWLEHVAEKMYGLVDKITTERDIPESLVT